MKQHDREYFISRIRCGYYTFKENGITLKIYTPTLEDEYEINEVYRDAYERAMYDDFKTEDEMIEWMREKELWTQEDDDKIEGLKKDLERLKVEIFNARNNETLREKIRMYIRAGEKQLTKQSEKKNAFQMNTCEGVALLEKSIALLKRCTFLNGQLYNFESIQVDEVLSKYYAAVFSDAEIRELSRSEPWRSLWILNETNTFNLFNNGGRCLSIDQRNLLIWSKMYDNVQESLDCPSEDVIEDDDMLDGWFIVQRKKREKERAESEMENTIKNDKIKNSSEIYMVAQTQKDAERINNMNDITGKVVKQQRFNVIKNKGEASQIDFQDERLKLSQQSNNMFKDKFRR